MINKDNTRLNLTFKKSDLVKLNLINTTLNNRFNMEFSKSQTIQFLINNFDEKTLNRNSYQISKIKPFKHNLKESNLTKQEEEKKNLIKSIPINKNTVKTTENGLTQINNIEYLNTQKLEMSAKLHELKTRLGLTIKEISEMLNINFETYKDYHKGKRYPTGNNLVIIEKCLIKYGIK